MKNKLLLFFILVTVKSISQEYFPNNESTHNKNHTITAITNAKIYVSPTEIIEKGTLLIQDGKVLAVGQSVSIPKKVTLIDLNGKTIYPSFIDIFTDFGTEKPKALQSSRRNQTYDTKRTGYYWNEHIRSEINAIDAFSYDKTKADDFLKAGFGVVGIHINDGIAQGSGALIALNNNQAELRVLSNKISNHFSFKKSATSSQAYPTSLMGSMALLRQLYNDLDWYKKGGSKTEDLSLQALQNNQNLIQIFDANDKLNSLRAAKIGKEYQIAYILKGSGDEFERIEAIKNTNAKFIIPINFPDAYDVSNPYIANQLDFRDLRFWNQAPTNPKVLADNNIIFAFTTDKLKKTEDFRTNVLKAVQFGLSKTKALEALTSIPAQILGKQNEIGSLKKGNWANFIITSGDYFDKDTKIYENWVQGNKFEIINKDKIDLRGNYDLVIQNQAFQLNIKGELDKPTIELKAKADSTKIEAKITQNENWITIIAKGKNDKYYRLTAYLESPSLINGTAVLESGETTNWTAKKTTDFTANPKEKNTEEIRKLYPVTLPNIAFGNLESPKQETIVFKNATVWTNEKEGIAAETDVLVKNGKIALIGKSINPGNATVIDATGKHLTSGIIDEHSHIAISNGVNESGHNSSAEVTIQDVVNSEDINIYRQLAGGVTTSQLLHGSANPIGGRSAIVKWKWGATPDEILYPNQPGFIKFALGENVKQSNWSNDNPIRYPQTRMGVEQVFTDYFQRAKEYDLSKNSNSKSKKNQASPFRKDLEMEVISEILNKKRFITCHSYVASEILMLMNVAEKFDFRVNTFTHILEGYKVADEMKAHGVGASTFSDWWAYKFEVNDAIPFNGPLLHNQEVLVAYNSDDSEMSRRLNQEAAKAVKYGNISEEEAWKFVTLNPAKLLHIDDKVGSIKVGKDADLVLWSDNPLSIYAQVEKTLIEGAVYFDLKKDEDLRVKNKQEREEIINQMLNEKNSGKKTQEPKKKEKPEYHCDTLEL